MHAIEGHRAAGSLMTKALPKKQGTVWLSNMRGASVKLACVNKKVSDTGYDKLQQYHAKFRTKLRIKCSALRSLGVKFHMQIIVPELRIQNHPRSGSRKRDHQNGVASDFFHFLPFSSFSPFFLVSVSSVSPVFFCLFRFIIRKKNGETPLAKPRLKTPYVVQHHYSSARRKPISCIPHPHSGPSSLMPTRMQNRCIS